MYGSKYLYKARAEVLGFRLEQIGVEFTQHVGDTLADKSSDPVGILAAGQPAALIPTSGGPRA